MNLLTLFREGYKKRGGIKRRITNMVDKANILAVSRSVHGENNKIKYKNVILKSAVFDIIGNNNSVVIMDGCFLENVKFYIRGNENSIILHNKVKYNGTLWTTCNKGTIEIGMNTTTEINVNLQIAEDNGKIEVGNDCMFSSNISLWTQDWHKIYNENEERINHPKNIIIKDHVWVGYDSKILKGVTIGKNNIIGTDTIVTKSFEDENVVIAGNPGRIVKRGTNWRR